jgi:hypothetical protein
MGCPVEVSASTGTYAQGYRVRTTRIRTFSFKVRAFQMRIGRLFFFFRFPLTIPPPLPLVNGGFLPSPMM